MLSRYVAGRHFGNFDHQFITQIDGHEQTLEFVIAVRAARNDAASLRDCASSYEPGPARENARGDGADGNPHPDELNKQDSHPILGEETSDAKVGYKQRSPGHEVSSLREGRKEGNAESSIGECIKKAM